MDDAWCTRVTEACELQKDYLSLPNGNMTCVGSGWVSLSGGQRQSVASIIPRVGWRLCEYKH